MAKKSQRRSLRHEKDQAGCISGLINIFDFRHGRSTRKRLPDRRRESRQAGGSGSSRTKKLLPHFIENSQDAEDGKESGMTSPETTKASVKKLMEKEMFNEQGPNKHMNDPEMSQEMFFPDHGCHASENRKQLTKSCKRTNDLKLCDKDAVKVFGLDKPCDGVANKKTSDETDFEIIMHLLHDQFDVQSDHASAVDEEKLSAAIKILIDQSSSHVKHSTEEGQNQQSTEFVDALNRLSSKKDLLLKLLQDPNSILVKQIKGLESAQLERDQHSDSFPRSGFSKEKLNLSKTDEHINHKQNRKFFRRRSKSQESFPSMASEKCQFSSKIVILKPVPATLQQQNTEINVSTPMQTDYSGGNKFQGERSHFSFTEIKRKLKHAIKKERQGVSPDGISHKTPLDHQKGHDFEKGVGGENVGWCSPNRNHFYTERFAKPSIHVKRGDKVGKSNDAEAVTLKETSEYTKPGVSDIYLEAKKHLLEMLSSGGDDAELNNQQLPKSLGRILSFSEYNFSPNSSPRMGTEDSSISAKRTLSPRGGIGVVKESTDQFVQETLDDQSSPLRYSSEIESHTTHVNGDEKVEFLEESRCLSCEHSHAHPEEEALLAVQGAIISEGATRIEETTNLSQEDNKIPDAACQLNSSYGTEDGQNGDIDGDCPEDGWRQSLEMESLGEYQIVSSPLASPSRSSVNNKIEDFESASDRTERPSPVSVLEPLFVEDDISPARTISRPVELEIQPQQIHFEEWSASNDQGVCIQTSLGDEESAFEYVEAVLLGSGLVWDEYLIRWLSASPILDSILYEEVELFSSRSSHEQRLLFDCTNEVLEEVCDRYFGCFPLISSSKKTIRPAPTRMNLIREIWEGVDWHFLQYPQSESLDLLLKKDMERSRTWMDLQLDIRHIGTEMEAAILDNLVEDAISSFIKDALDSVVLSSSADLTEVHGNDL